MTSRSEQGLSPRLPENQRIDDMIGYVARGVSAFLLARDLHNPAGTLLRGVGDTQKVAKTFAAVLGQADGTPTLEDLAQRTGQSTSNVEKQVGLLADIARWIADTINPLVQTQQSDQKQA